MCNTGDNKEDETKLVRNEEGKESIMQLSDSSKQEISYFKREREAWIGMNRENLNLP